MHLMGYLDPKGTGVGESRKHRLASICLRFVRFGSVRFCSVLFGSVLFGSVRFGLVWFAFGEAVVIYCFIVFIISFIYSFLSFILFSSF